MSAIKDDGLDLHTIILLPALPSPSLPPSALREQNHSSICPDFSAWASQDHIIPFLELNQKPSSGLGSNHVQRQKQGDWNGFLERFSTDQDPEAGG